MPEPFRWNDRTWTLLVDPDAEPFRLLAERVYQFDRIENPSAADRDSALIQW
jgi:hypothetical protein